MGCQWEYPRNNTQDKSRCFEGWNSRFLVTFWFSKAKKTIFERGYELETHRLQHSSEVCVEPHNSLLAFNCWCKGTYFDWYKQIFLRKTADLNICRERDWLRTKEIVLRMAEMSAMLRTITFRAVTDARNKMPRRCAVAEQSVIGTTARHRCITFLACIRKGVLSRTT